jgi:hypothetical protein
VKNLFLCLFPDFREEPFFWFFAHYRGRVFQLTTVSRLAFGFAGLGFALALCT